LILPIHQDLPKATAIEKLRLFLKMKFEPFAKSHIISFIFMPANPGSGPEQAPESRVSGDLRNAGTPVLVRPPEAGKPLADSTG